MSYAYYFTTVRCRSGVTPSEGPPAGPATMALEGTDYVGLKAWWNDLTYDEVHAFVVGFGPMFFATVAYAIGFTAPAQGAIALVALGFAVAFKQTDAPSKFLKILPRSVWYYSGGVFGGGVFGTVFGAVLTALALV